jgi:branched-chain amino acid aminotransferase
MSTWVMIDGRIFSEQTACVSIFDRGFLYGDSVFETLRTYGGKPFALDEHLKRLAWSASRVHIALPRSEAELAAEIGRLLAHAQNPESMIRVMLTRGVGPLGLDVQPDVPATRVVIVAPLRPPALEAYTAGVRVITYRTQRLADATDAAGAKIGNYLIAVLAMREAKSRGAVEALIIDAHDAVVEGTSSNLFAVQGGKLLTPPETTGILPGITRARILEIAGELGLGVEYRALPLSELVQADEVFISSTVREMLPVVCIDDRPIAGGKPGPLTTRLLAAFRARVSASSAQR